MTDKVQKIREFLVGMADSACCDYATERDIRNIILPYIDSLKEDPKHSSLERIEKNWKEEPVSEDLEKAAKHYLYSNILYDDVYVGNPTDKDCIEMFKAGAQWQKEKDDKLFTIVYMDGVEKGKQQMMKDAIETTLSKGLEEDCNIKGKYKAYIIVIKED